MHYEIEKLIEIAIADGLITDKERSVILKKALELGVDIDEVEMTLEGRLHQIASQKSKMREKVGHIKVCPACGETLKALDVKCSACGHNFSDLEVNLSISQLKDKLTHAKDEQERIKILKIFTPNKDKEATIDALHFLLGQVVSENLTELELKTNNVLKQKSQEIISRSKIYYAQDQEFKNFVDDFSINLEEKFKTSVYFKKIGKIKQKRSYTFTTIGFVTFFGVFIILKKLNPNLEDQQSVTSKIWPIWLILSIVLIAVGSYFNVDYKKHKKRFPFLEEYK